MIEISRAERWAAAGALVLIALQALPAAAPWLEYRRALALAEPWRVVTAHWVHVNWPHALVNAAAWLVVARLFAPELALRRQLLVVSTASLAIAVGLAWLYPEIAWYRGFSGVLHTLFFAGATRATIGALAARVPWRERGLPLLLLVGGAIKVLAEQPGGAQTPFASWLGATTVPQAHGLGAACGAVLGLLGRSATAQPHSERQQAKQ